MIAATLHWLLRAMWHANHFINIHVSAIGESDFTKTTQDKFLWMKWSTSIVRTDSSYKASGIQDGIHARLACIGVAVWKISPTTFYNSEINLELFERAA